jgi:serine protease Do
MKLNKLVVFAVLAGGLFLSGSGWVGAAENEQPSIGIQITAEEGKDHPVVKAIVEKGPAAKAGMKEGDLIVKVADTEVKTPQEAVKVLLKQKPGDKLKIVVSRDGKEMPLEVTVGKRSELFSDKK